MANIARFIEQMRGKPKNMHFGDLQAVVRALGYELSRVKGSHHIYTMPERPFIDLQKDGGKAKPYQIKQVLEIIDAYGFPKE